jgi:hypothetical protein
MVGLLSEDRSTAPKLRLVQTPKSMSIARMIVLNFIRNIPECDQTIPLLRLSNDEQMH